MANLGDDFIQKLLLRFTNIVGTGSRSSALGPLITLELTIGLILFLAAWVDAPANILLWLVAVMGFVAVVACSFFAYFAFKDPKALRSETFVLKQQLIEKFGGTSDTGLVELSEQSMARVIEAGSIPKDDDEK